MNLMGVILKNMISVIIPVYNVEKYIDRCVTSIVNQTYKHLEIILVDDGSTDQSGKICDNWKMKDSRILVIHKSNHGVSSARNRGLRLAKGQFISFIDADDWIDLDMYEKLIKYMNNNNADIGICGYIKESNTLIKDNFKKTGARLVSREDAIIEIFRYENNKVPKSFSWEICDKIFTKEMLSNLNFDESIYNGEDMLFCWLAFKNAKKIAYLPLYSYHYFMRESSAVHQKQSTKSISVLKAVRSILNDTKNESCLIQNTIEDHYLRVGVRHSKQMFRLHAVQYREEVLYFQKFLRTHIYHSLCLPYVSLKGKIGMLIFCLPYQVCKLLLSLKSSR